MPTEATLKKILDAIAADGGETFVVGGPVRDRLQGIEPKDIDFLVRKLTLNQIDIAISTIGKADEVGKSFGVVKGTIDGEVFDFVIPRIREVKTGVSHTDFIVDTDPFASVESDLGRRDFTINAMAIPLEEFIFGSVGNIIDPFSGGQDLENRLIRAVGDPVARFTEDPLRILRGIQFSTRFGFDIDSATFEAMKSLAPTLKTVSGERVFEEFKKAWTKGKGDTGRFIDLLQKSGIGALLFGSGFNPATVRLDGFRGDDLILAHLTAFFLHGGDMSIMKPEAIHTKFLDVAKKVAFSDLEPHTFIGNMKPHLPVLFALAFEMDKSLVPKIGKMMNVPLIPKELAVTGEELIEILGIKNPKEGKRIGEAQRAMLSAIWNDTLVNEKQKLVDFLKV